MQHLPNQVSKPEEPEDNPTARDIVRRLRAGELPQMVDWFDPGLLAKVGVRSIISATLGAYTDQRLIQAATDFAEEDELKSRYDFSGGNPALPALELDKDGAVWIDYIADLGDGFEATYSMAYLMAADRLKVEGDASALPAGRLLIMGGDQVYPDATKQEYHSRLRDPYDWAFTTENPTRHVFAIPGNHDWYDGLSSFSALFCTSRDRISGGIGTQIGGWRCHQHRSYFAIKLPHNWWLWGPDIQLADNLDDSQRDYFDLMADQTKEGDNIILFLAEPSWHHQNYDNMHEISMLARKRGAKICAVIAGDWHHYSRYTNEQLGTHFITSGGGGAFAHSTHGLKTNIKLKWASPTGGTRTASASDSVSFNRSEQAVIGPGGPDFTQRHIDISADPGGGEGAGSGVGGRRAKAVRKEDIDAQAYDLHAPHIYPPRWKSRLLSFWNLLLPFRNRGFTTLVGIVYFIFAWVWVSADPRQSPIIGKVAEDLRLQAISAEKSTLQNNRELEKAEERLRQFEARRPAEPLPQIAPVPVIDVVQRAREDAEEAKARLNTSNEILAEVMTRIENLDGGRHVRFETQKKFIEADESLSPVRRWLAFGLLYQQFYSLSLFFDPKAFFLAGEQSPLFAFMLIGLLAGLIFYAEGPDGKLGPIVRTIVGSVHFLAHVATLLIISWLATSIGSPTGLMLKAVFPNAPWPDIVRVAVNFIVTLFLGGLLGGFVMGIYWTIMCAFFNRHTGDAFGALGLKDYKHFLRMKLEPDKATIYAIGLDKVPGRQGWRWKLEPGEQRPPHNPQIMPVEPLRPHLIEPPIVIEAAKVKA